MPYILALDEGTTSARAILFDHDGAIRSVAQREIRQSYPKPGWVEHDPQEIWTSQMQVAAEALRQGRLRPRDLAAVGITNQRETTIVWDRQTGRAIHPAIVWQDRRTAGSCDRLRADGCERLFQKRTGLLLDPYFSGTKLAWILDHVPGARKRAAAGGLAFGTVDTWLLWQLTGRHLTDPSNASRTLLFNIHTGDWDKELLRLLRIPESVLPVVRSSSETYGEAARSSGLAGVPVGGIAGDQQAALFGQMCLKPGLTKNTYGTGCFMLQHTGTKPVASRHRLLTTVAWRIGSQLEYALEGSVFIGGAVVQWLRDSLGLIRTAGEIEQLAASVPDNSGVYLVPAFAGLGAPHWDPYARGALVGLTRDSTAAHVARAALESIAFQVADLQEAMRHDSGIALKELRVDGGAARNNLLLQFQADILGVPVVRPAVTESTALGAAYLAGLAVGFWKTRQEIASQWRVDRRFDPQMPRPAARALRERWTSAVSRAKGWETSATI
ncbi:MAG TPA: glycerol kinase GlpK, partial [Candidatus Binatia bacterium]|nr:glycerol kinase GlpK [Candidatus Binatia bacterium]